MKNVKNEIASRGQVITAAFLPAGVGVGLCLLLFGLAYSWWSDRESHQRVSALARAEAAETGRKVTDLRNNKPRIDAAWVELSAGTLRLTGVPGTPAAAGQGAFGRGVGVNDIPLSRGAAASGGFNAASRSRDLPETLGAFAEADMVILPQPATSDRQFRRWGVGSDRIEFGRLVPLLASVESRFPLALVEEAVLSLPAGAAVFGTDPRPLDLRMVFRLPTYDPAARAAELNARKTRRASSAGTAQPASAPGGVAAR